MAKKKQKPDFTKPKQPKTVFQEDDSSKGMYPLVVNDAAKENGADDEIQFFSDKTYFNLPLVVIAGRPNVGKSTLFNRLLHRRIAITSPVAGTTRDVVESTAFIMGKPVHLMDTGGYKLTRDEGTMEAVMDDLVVAKTLDTFAKADVIVLMMDSGEITAEDEELIAELRPYWNKVIGAINKTEGGKNENDAWNFMQFGFGTLFRISASHGDRITELCTEIVSRLDFSRVSEGEKENAIRVALIGKPNTGKSTLSNRLTHTQTSIVSDYAGTTRDVVEGSFRYGNRDFQILDTAGIRRKARVTADVEYYSVNRAIKSLDQADIVFLMIDAEEGLSEQDKKIVELAFERGRGIIFVLNKWDKLKEQVAEDRKFAKKTEENIRIMFGQMSFAPIVEISALEGRGIKALLDKAIELYDELNRKIDTAALNAALKDWLFKYPPPASKAIHFKIRYMTQSGVNPVRFIIFATRPDSVPESYVTYLKNRIREDLGFDQIPVQLEMKASRQKWEDRAKGSR